MEASLTVRSTAEQRRAQIRAAAAAAFATAGLHGTSVETIARTIGISEAYVFRLFGTKRSLFIEVITDAFDAMTTNRTGGARARCTQASPGPAGAPGV